MPKFNWKQKKTIAMYLNKRQAIEDGEPINTSEFEILVESGNFLVRETSTNSNIKYIITE